MSYTEIYSFGKDGTVEGMADVKNAFRGAMAIWRFLEEKYLPSLPAMWDSDDIKYWSRTTPTLSKEEDPIQEVWDLVESDKLTLNEKICMMSTFDNVLIKRENIGRLLIAFRDFEGETSLKEQADAIEELSKKNDVIAIGFNQTSVNGDTWSNYNYDEDTEESMSYNCLKQDKHWWLFDSLARQEAEPV